jgi:oxygen-independent coproporphyrinogen III oxidase
MSAKSNSNPSNSEPLATKSKSPLDPDSEDNSLSLYVHFPFCSRICGYCDFHKELFDCRKEASYFQALAVDTALAAEELFANRRNTGKIKLESVYIGGGTPSLISPQLFTGWVSQLRELFEFADDLEFTVEVNPESANAENLGLFQQSGVNRLSVGVQSFDTESLKALDRRHKVEDTLRVFYVARASGIENISADLIFGLPNQTLHHLHHDLSELLDLEPSHISYYQLTVKDNTQLAKDVQSGALTLPDNDTMAMFYRAGSEYFADHGFERYEVSSFAKDGARSRHNTRYWSNRPYLALGPGAHGFTGEHRYALVSDTAKYVSSLLDDKARPLVWDMLTERDRMLEDIMLALRTTDGLDISRFRKSHSRSPEELFDSSEYRKLLGCGHLAIEKGRLRLSEEALALADEIIARLTL